jgi:hypothetical protein
LKKLSSSHFIATSGAEDMPRRPQSAR